MARQRQHEAEREIGDRIGVAPRREQHRNAQLGGALHADVDRIAAAAADEAQPAAVEHLLVHQVGLDDQHVGADGMDALGELRAVEVDRVTLAPVLVHDVHVPLQAAAGRRA